jgi:hypothetical protein
MATLAVIHTFAQGNPVLREKFLASRLQAAWDILGEASPSVARKAWATKVFADYYADADKEYRWALSHANVQTAGTNITDANMITATKSFIDAWAAVT